MATYLNAYTMIGDMRYGINEYSSDYITGDDTTGVYQNDHLLRCLNRSVRFIYAILMNYIPGEFLTSTTLTGSDSVFTLPWDFGSLRLFEDENGRKVFKANVDTRPDGNAEGSDRIYYRSGNTLVLTKDGVSETYTLWYYTKPRDIHYAQAGASSGVALLHMDTTDAKRIDDYYNGMTVENITQNLTESITDYAITATVPLATVASTPANDDWYGLVPEVPEIFHHLIVPRALMIAKAEHPVSPKQPGRDEMSMWRDELRDALIAFGCDRDITPEDIWMGSMASPPSSGIVIPGQGYTIY